MSTCRPSTTYRRPRHPRQGVTLTRRLNTNNVSILSTPTLNNATSRYSNTKRRLTTTHHQSHNRTTTTNNVTTLYYPNNPRLYPMSTLSTTSIQNDTTNELPFQLYSPCLRQPSHPKRSNNNKVRTLHIRHNMCYLYPPNLNEKTRPRPTKASPRRPRVTNQPNNTKSQNSTRLPTTSPHLPPQPTPPSTVRLHLRQRQRKETNTKMRPRRLLQSENRRNSSLLQRQNYRPRLLILYEPNKRLQYTTRRSNSCPTTCLNNQSEPLHTTLRYTKGYTPNLPRSRDKR